MRIILIVLISIPLAIIIALAWLAIRLLIAIINRIKYEIKEYFSIRFRPKREHATNVAEDVEEKDDGDDDDDGDDGDDDDGDDDDGDDDNARIPCSFDGPITESEFEASVYSVTKRIKRIESTSIDDGLVSCTVWSQSGISTWDFEIDFNDYGHITGSYSWWRENTDSDMPDHVAQNIQKKISHIIWNNS